jgi:hypothetical protein
VAQLILHRYDDGAFAHPEVNHADGAPSVRVPIPILIPVCSANVEGVALLDGFFHWLISSAAQALMGAEFGQEGDTTLKPRGSP